MILLTRKYYGKNNVYKLPLYTELLVPIKIYQYDQYLKQLKSNNVKNSKILSFGCYEMSTFIKPHHFRKKSNIELEYEKKYSSKIVKFIRVRN